MPQLDAEACRPEIALGETVYHVAYGSNLCSSKLSARAPKGREPIKPLSQTPVKVPGWRLGFGLTALPPSEPLMADVVQDETSTLHGIMFELTAYDYTSLCLSEHCAVRPQVQAYVEQTVEAFPYDGSAPRKATIFTHASPAQRVPESLGIAPSERYMRLLVVGAQEAGLQEDYVQWLKSLPAARPVKSSISKAICGLSLLTFIGLYNADIASPLTRFMQVYIFPLLRQLYVRRERAATNGRRLTEMVWHILCMSVLVPFAVIGSVFGFLFKARVVFNEGNK